MTDIVMRDLLTTPKDPKAVKKAKKKIIDMVETEERKKSVSSFLREWNWWRDFYHKLPPVEIKTKSQLTMIENIIEFCNSNDYKINMMIACVQRAYVKYKFKPGFDVILKRGEELYDYHYDLVEADVDREDYEERAIR